ncbi:unnamed protein product [marine sediment metagenome]|uniref:Uncharacterized protein n=1 Tax=marine sediment metagenome TaxID=412755 RepID=X1LLT4_9ZZZZ
MRGNKQVQTEIGIKESPLDNIEAKIFTMFEGSVFRIEIINSKGSDQAEISKFEDRRN